MNENEYQEELRTLLLNEKSEFGRIHVLNLKDTKKIEFMNSGTENSSKGEIDIIAYNENKLYLIEVKIGFVRTKGFYQCISYGMDVYQNQQTRDNIVNAIHNDKFDNNWIDNLISKKDVIMVLLHEEASMQTAYVIESLNKLFKLPLLYMTGTDYIRNACKIGGVQINSWLNTLNLIQNELMKKFEFVDIYTNMGRRDPEHYSFVFDKVKAKWHKAFNIVVTMIIDSDNLYVHTSLIMRSKSKMKAFKKVINNDPSFQKKYYNFRDYNQKIKLSFIPVSKGDYSEITQYVDEILKKLESVPNGL